MQKKEKMKILTFKGINIRKNLDTIFQKEKLILESYQQKGCSGQDVYNTKY